MFEYFFRTAEDAAAPNFPIVFIFGYIIALVYIAKKFKRPKEFALISIALQIIMMTWYGFAGTLFSIGLPFYHCRIVLWAVSLGLLFEKRSKVLVWLSMLGIPTSLLVLLMRDMHPYSFPHLTNFYYLLSHGMIFLLSVSYLEFYYVKLTSREMTIYTLVLHSFVLLIDIILKANYAYLVRLPLIKDAILNKFSFILISIAILLISLAMNKVLNKEEVRDKIGIEA